MDSFYGMDRVIKKGLTFDDVLLIPKKSELDSRSLTDLRTRITKNVTLNIPLISLCMATVTESEMAIAMALEGGIGIIHRFIPIEEQAAEVRRVKRSTGEIIYDPVIVYDDILLKEAIDIAKRHGVTGLVVVNRAQKLAGMLTQRDFVFEENLDMPVYKLMTPREKLVVAHSSISIADAKKLLSKNRIEKLPLVDEQDNLMGLIAIKDIKHVEQYSNACRDGKGRLRVAAAIGIKGDFMERAEALVREHVDVLVVDVAHAHSEKALNAIREIKKKFPVDLLAGNVATAEGAEALIQAGVDGVKVGIGNGTICTTRLIAGAGVPQMTAILETSAVGKKHGIPVICDGGITTPGNFSKAIAAGSDAVMSGSIFAGTDESPGPIIYKNGRQYKYYLGSTSYMSNVINTERSRKEKVKEYLRDAFVEGVESLVPYKGPVKEVINGFLKGLRSGMSYCGAYTIKEMQEKAEFIEISDAGRTESGMHGVESAG